MNIIIIENLINLKYCIYGIHENVIFLAFLYGILDNKIVNESILIIICVLLTHIYDHII